MAEEMQKKTPTEAGVFKIKPLFNNAIDRFPNSA